MSNVFLDDTWRDIPANYETKFKTVRCNEPAPQHVTMVSHAKGMENLYFVNSKAVRSGDTPTPAPVTPAAETPTDKETMALGHQYLHAITRHHGSTLKHLLFSDQWAFGQDDIRDIIRFCPNLEQLGLAIDTFEDLSTIRLLIPFLPRLHSIRFLPNEVMEHFVRDVAVEDQFALLGEELEKAGARHVSYLGFGDRIMHAGKSYVDDNGQWRKDVTLCRFEDVEHIEIWGLDRLDISLDPLAT